MEGSTYPTSADTPQTLFSGPDRCSLPLPRAHPLIGDKPSTWIASER
jgi:hypothetical protein